MAENINLSNLTFPGIVETISFEDILAAMLADLRTRDPTFDALVESDPAYKIMEVAAYREVLIRQRVNEAAKACMLAYATGSDLEQLGAIFGVTRLVLDEGDPEAVPPVLPTYETDAALRARIQLALEGFSTAGPAGAYTFHALSVTGVKDASAISPNPGEVLVTVLAATGNGTADPALVEAVDDALSDDDVRPLTDQVTVQGAEIIEYEIDAELYLYEGPDEAVVLAEAIAAVTAYKNENHLLGRDITLSGLYAALHRPGVQRVELTAPSDTISVDDEHAAYCTSVTVVVAGRSE